MNRSRSQTIQSIVALQPRLRRFAYGLSGSMDEADDLVQSAFERALQRLDQWQQGTRIDSWMYRIVQTGWLNRLRAGRVRGEHLASVELEEQGSDRSQRQTEAQMLLDKVRHCIQKLPPDQRAPLLLISVEGLSYKEASEVLDIPVGTLTSRLARGRVALLVMMEPTTATGLNEAGSVKPQSNQRQSRSDSGVVI